MVYCKFFYFFHCKFCASLATTWQSMQGIFYEGILHDLNLLLQSRLIAKWASAKYGHLMACTVASCCRWCFSTTIQSRICISCTVVSHWCSALIQSLRFSTTIQSRAHSLSILTKIYGEYFLDKHRFGPSSLKEKMDTVRLFNCYFNNKRVFAKFRRCTSLGSLNLGGPMWCQ